MFAARRLRRPRLARFVVRQAALLAALSLVFALVTGAKRFFFCAGMERLHADVSCCSHFEAALEDQVREQSYGSAIGEDESCCSERRHRVLPGGVAAAELPSLASPWVGETPAVAKLAAPPTPPALQQRAAVATGPPILSAPELCARLSIYIV